MGGSVVDHNHFVFADADAGGGGHVINLGSSLSANQADILCINSDTLVDTPSGFSLAPTRVGNQGSYVFRRLGSGAANVTITTSGNHDTEVLWLRLGSINAADDAKSAQVDGSSDTTSPAVSTATLAETNEAVIAFAALHNYATAPTTPVWSTGYTNIETASQKTSSSGVAGFVGVSFTAGTPAESPSVTWTNAAGDRYMLLLTFTTLAGVTDITGSDSGTLTDSGAVTAAAPGVDSAAVTDSGVTAAGILSTDNAALADSAVAVVAASGTETLALSDTGTVSGTPTSTDSASLTESTVMAGGPAGTETGTLGEAGVAAISAVGSDSAALTDSGSVQKSGDIPPSVAATYSRSGPVGYARSGTLVYIR